MGTNQSTIMEEDILDPIFYDMVMPNVADKRKFLEVCRESYDRRSAIGLYVVFNHWKVYASLMVQMGFADLNSDDICSELQNFTGGMLQVNFNDRGKIDSLRFEPKTNDDRIGRILDVLCTSDYCCEALVTLRGLKFIGSGCNMNGRHLEILLLQLLPKFPNFHRLAFHKTSSIESFKELAERIRSDNSLIISKSLRQVRFEKPFQDIASDPDLTAAILTFLKAFVTVDYISFHPRCVEKIDPEFKYVLLTNMIGRRLLEGNSAKGDDRSGNSRLPLSIWPIILQRAQFKIDESILFNENAAFWSVLVDHPQWRKNSAKATGIYYLLREGTALIGRNNLVRNHESADTKNHHQPTQQKLQSFSEEMRVVMQKHSEEMRMIMQKLQHAQDLYIARKTRIDSLDAAEGQYESAHENAAAEQRQRYRDASAIAAQKFKEDLADALANLQRQSENAHENYNTLQTDARKRFGQFA